MTALTGAWPGSLDERRHRTALTVFLLLMLAHWAEHIAQAIQVYALGWPGPRARGVLGIWFPWLIQSEWMHYGYALITLAGLAALAPGFAGRAKKWWKVALWIQVWHHFEHLLLLIQAVTGKTLLGSPQPTSILQLLLPRMELHLFYNVIVSVPMAVAVCLHLRHRTEN